jgi:hypothetical protein
VLDLLKQQMGARVGPPPCAPLPVWQGSMRCSAPGQRSWPGPPPNPAPRRLSQRQLRRLFQRLFPAGPPSLPSTARPSPRARHGASPASVPQPAPRWSGCCRRGRLYPTADEAARPTGAAPTRVIHPPTPTKGTSGQSFEKKRPARGAICFVGLLACAHEIQAH